MTLLASPRPGFPTSRKAMIRGWWGAPLAQEHGTAEVTSDLALGDTRVAPLRGTKDGEGLEVLGDGKWGGKVCLTLCVHKPSALYRGKDELASGPQAHHASSRKDIVTSPRDVVFVSSRRLRPQG